MIKQQQFSEIEQSLRKFLSKEFKDVQVQVGEGIHYRGTNVVIMTKAFEGLLPEQRFHHVVHEIPPSFYEQHLRSGLVWFELAPGESAQEYMKRPRSEDVQKDDATIREGLTKASFYPRMAAALSAPKGQASQRDFFVARRVLSEAGFNAEQTERAILHFIGRGAFSDADLAAALVGDGDRDDDEDDSDASE